MYSDNLLNYVKKDFHCALIHNNKEPLNTVDLIYSHVFKSRVKSVT